MKLEFRERKMLEYLTDREILTVEEAVERFCSSPATVRRDFNRLVETGSVSRIRGGIARLPRQDSLLPFGLREKWYSEEKRLLAEKTMRLISPGETLFIDGGTTTSHLGMYLPESGNTIITNSLPLCEILSGRFQNKGSSGVLLTGGRLHMMSGLLLGSGAEESILQYHADTTVMSVRGIDTQFLYNDTESITGVEKAMLARSERLIVIADHSKIGRRAMALICGIRKMNCLVTTETPENADVLNKLRNAGVSVVV